jgi:hypothetical protein
MSNQQLAEREAVPASATGQTREPGPQRSAAADHSEDHLIRGYD